MGKEKRENHVRNTSYYIKNIYEFFLWEFNEWLEERWR